MLVSLPTSRESLGWEGGGLEGEGLSSESPSPSNLSFIQRPHHLFRSNGLHTRMVAITVLLAVQRTGATIQLRLKNPILRPRREKPHSSVVGPNSAKTGVPTAPARCIGPESPVINREEDFNNAHVSRRDVRLVKLRDAGIPSIQLPRPMTIHGMPRDSKSSMS